MKVILIGASGLGMNPALMKAIEEIENREGENVEIINGMTENLNGDEIIVNEQDSRLPIFEINSLPKYEPLFIPKQSKHTWKRPYKFHR